MILNINTGAKVAARTFHALAAPVHHHHHLSLLASADFLCITEHSGIQEEITEKVKEPPHEPNAMLCYAMRPHER